MLNTDMHNPNVRVKLSMQHFIRNLVGTNDGGNFDENLLKEIYEDIAKNPILKRKTEQESSPSILKSIVSKLTRIIKRN
jgi:Sec7-like guanine-nucleotide exchange factor